MNHGADPIAAQPTARKSMAQAKHAATSRLSTKTMVAIMEIGEPPRKVGGPLREFCRPGVKPSLSRECR